MEKVTKKQIAMAFTGSFFGAGFLSGQELFQFFGVFGVKGILGMFLALLCFYISGYLVMVVTKKTGLVEFDKIIVRKNIPPLRMLFIYVIIFFLFGVVVIMIAGAGALLNESFGMPKYLGNILMSTTILFISIYGAKGVLNTFSLIVPIMVCIAMIVGIMSLFKIDIEPNWLNLNYSSSNPMLGNWFFATIAFVPYNMLAAFSILVPIAPHVDREKTIKKGILLGTVLLAVVFIFILIPLILHRNLIANVELPMIKIASTISPLLGLTYSILLICGMFATSLSCLFGVTTRIRASFSIDNTRLSLYLLILALLGSLLGFKKLISILFPICGYVGFFALIGIFLHYLHLKKNDKNKLCP